MLKVIDSNHSKTSLSNPDDQELRILNGSPEGKIYARLRQADSILISQGNNNIEDSLISMHQHSQILAESLTDDDLEAMQEELGLVSTTLKKQIFKKTNHKHKG